MKIKLNNRELAHVLLGLRMQQVQSHVPSAVLSVRDDLIHAEDHQLMSNNELDDLCERINCSGKDDKPKKTLYEFLHEGGYNYRRKLDDIQQAREVGEFIASHFGLKGLVIIPVKEGK